MNNQIKQQHEAVVRRELSNLLAQASAFWRRAAEEYAALSPEEQRQREVDRILAEPKGGE